LFDLSQRRFQTKFEPGPFAGSPLDLSQQLPLDPFNRFAVGLLGLRHGSFMALRHLVEAQSFCRQLLVEHPLLFGVSSFSVQ
jgi:hypothetical protein